MPTRAVGPVDEDDADLDLRQRGQGEQRCGGEGGGQGSFFDSMAKPPEWEQSLLRLTVGDSRCCGDCGGWRSAGGGPPEDERQGNAL